MKYIIETNVRKQEFYDRVKARTYFNACVRIGVGARFIQEDVLGRQTVLAEVA